MKSSRSNCLHSKSVFPSCPNSATKLPEYPQKYADRCCIGSVALRPPNKRGENQSATSAHDGSFYPYESPPGSDTQDTGRACAEARPPQTRHHVSPPSWWNGNSWKHQKSRAIMSLPLSTDISPFSYKKYKLLR